MTDTTMHPADEVAIDKVLACDPVWQDLKSAGEALELGSHTLLHAGPSFTAPDAINKPILNSAVIACVYEGIAKTFDEAEDLILAGNIELRPAQDFSVVTPLAAVVSRSMALQVVTDSNNAERCAYSPINGGSGPAMRLGLREPAVLDHIRWLNGEFADAALKALDSSIPLIALARRGIQGGDDCHGRTAVATAALTEHVTAGFGTGAGTEKAREFLTDGPSFFLNLWMAACMCMLQCAVGVENSALVTAAGANGAQTGIQIAGRPNQWYTAEAAPPNGALENDMPQTRALGAIGDSAIVDALGFGAMAMAHSPNHPLLAYMPENGLDLPNRLLLKMHPGFAPLAVRIGLSARAVVSSDHSPVVSLGILDAEGTAGRLGGGIFEQPMRLFTSAMDALQG